jgi:hypothetical protein
MSDTKTAVQRPTWFHGKGELMHPTFNPLFAGNRLRLTTGSGHVTIRKSSMPGLWQVKWAIYRPNPHRLKEAEKDKVDGIVTLTTQELYLAFDSVLGSFDKGGTDREFTKTHCLTVGIQGKYARKGAYLNIPCMGTGKEGDPNASILLSEKVTLALMSFITHVASKS